MRKLASIQRIRALTPIGGADRVVKATINGYDCVVGKDDFKVGDLCVYVENDSILPVDNPHFAQFEGKRIKIKRIRGVWSYGVAFPAIGNNGVLPIGCFHEGDDLTERLGVKKWEPPVITAKERKQSDNLIRVPFPSWIPKTDETRFQAIIDILKPYEGVDCIVTEKLDGTSTTHWLDEEGNYHLASRNREIVDKSEIFYRGAFDADIPDLMKDFKPRTILQGELVGPGIAGNKYNLNKFKIFMFNVRHDNKFGGLNSFNFIRFTHKFDTVPVVHEHYKLHVDIDHLLELSMGKSVINPNIQREGIVIRPRENIYISDPQAAQYFVDGRLSFKVINPKFEVSQ